MTTNDVFLNMILYSVLINAFRHLTDNDILVQEDLKLIIESIIKKQKKTKPSFNKFNSINMVNINKWLCRIILK